MARCGIDVVVDANPQQSPFLDQFLWTSDSVGNRRKRTIEHQAHRIRDCLSRLLLADPITEVFGSTRLSKAFANFFCFSIVAILFTAPFYVRPWFATGVPTYPYFADWFVSSESMAMMSRHHHELGSNFGLRSAIGFFTAPIMMTFLEDLYDGGFGWQSLIMLAMIGSGFVRWKRSRRLSLRRIDRRSSTLLWTGLGLYSFWFFTSQQARLPFRSFSCSFWCEPISSSLFASCKNGLDDSCTLCLLFEHSLCDNGYYLATWGTVLGLVSEEDHLREGTGGTYIDLVHYLNAKPSPCHPLLVLEHRTFYLNHPSRIITPNFQLGPLTPARHFQNSESSEQLSETAKVPTWW